MSSRVSTKIAHLFFIALLFALAPINFLHLLPHFTTHLVGDVLDTAQYPWNVWWTAHALLDHKSNPFYSNYMLYPLGINMVHHTYTFLDGLLYTLVRPWVPLLGFHNLITWISIFLNSLAAYLLVFKVTGLSGLAFIGALAFGHSPILTSYQGTQSLIEPYLFVFFVLASCHLFEVCTYRWGIFAGILLGLSVYNYPYFFVFGLVWLTVLVLYRLFPWSVKPIGAYAKPGRFRLGTLPVWQPPAGKETVRILILSALILAAALLTAFPYTQSYLADPGTRSAVKSLPLDFETFSVDLASFFAPMHPWLSGLSQKIAADWKLGGTLRGTSGFFGYLWMILLIFGFGLFFKREGLRLWVLAWLVFFFFCLGPYLKFHGLTYTGFVLPGSLLPNLPLLGSARTLSRYVVPLTLCAVVIGCLVLKDVLQKISPSTRFWCYSGLALVTAFETALIPYPLRLSITDYRVPPVYEALAEKARGRAGVLLDLPLHTQSGDHWKGKRETRTFFYQTVHGQRNVGGFSSKLDDSVFDFFRKLPTVEAFWEQRPITGAELEAFLTAVQTDWIVVEKSRYDPQTLETYLTAISQIPAVQKFYEDSDSVAFQMQRNAAVSDGTK